MFPRSAWEHTAKPVRYTLVLCACLAFVFGLSVVVQAEEPAEKPSEKEVSPQKGLEGLGFSIAPKEGGKARTSLFGVVGEGYKFVFVIDRSGSMGGEGRNSLRAVKAELIESLKNLDSVHQFQLIFYNQRPVLMNPAGAPGRLAFGTDENKRRATRFLDSITAGGGTDHEAALKMAVRMQPDVIFLLTDADDPILEPAQLAKIRHTAAGIIINAIEFGPGPKPARPSFLADLARQNGGGYAYVDASKFDAGKAPGNPGR
ncbi:MAG: VWA domain-containing protein [Planctomycetes bacterium]|nr:VWA domain-containing protein [Planctomycetota bacterium]